MLNKGAAMLLGCRGVLVAGFVKLLMLGFDKAGKNWLKCGLLNCALLLFAGGVHGSNGAFWYGRDVIVFGVNGLEVIEFGVIEFGVNAIELGTVINAFGVSCCSAGWKLFCC